MNTVFTDVPFVTHFLFLWNNQASLTVCWTPATQQNAKDWSHTHVFVFNWHTHVVQNPPKSARSLTIQKCCKCIINHSEICSLVWDDHMHSLSTIEDGIATFLKAWKNGQFQSQQTGEKPSPLGPGVQSDCCSWMTIWSLQTQALPFKVQEK